jgi:hypothetical protein
MDGCGCFWVNRNVIGNERLLEWITAPPAIKNGRTETPNKSHRILLALAKVKLRLRKLYVAYVLVRSVSYVNRTENQNMSYKQDIFKYIW